MNIHHLYGKDDVEDDVIASDNVTRHVVFNTWNQSEDTNSKLAALRRVDTLETWLRDTRQDDHGHNRSTQSKRQLPRREKIIKYGLAATLVIAGIAYVAVNLLVLPKRKRVTRKPLRASEFRWVA